MGGWIGPYRFVQRLNDKLIVAGVSRHTGNDAIVCQIQRRAAICFLPIVQLEFRKIRQPFLFGANAVNFLFNRFSAAIRGDVRVWAGGAAEVVWGAWTD